MTTSEASCLVARILRTNLDSTFASLCTDRYGGTIALQTASRPDAPSSSLRVRIRPSEQPEVRAHFRIQHAGGNVFDIHGEVDGGPSRSFTFSLPDATANSDPRAPDLTRNVAEFLIDALERRVGSSVLERAARNKAPRSPDTRSRSSTEGAAETSQIS